MDNVWNYKEYLMKLSKIKKEKLTSKQKRHLGKLTQWSNAEWETLYS